MLRNHPRKNNFTQILADQIAFAICTSVLILVKLLLQVRLHNPFLKTSTISQSILCMKLLRQSEGFIS